MAYMKNVYGADGALVETVRVEGDIPPGNPEQGKAAQIAALQEELAATDYKVIKCSEFVMTGLTPPYDMEELHAQRQALRDKINALETEEGESEDG